MSAGRDARGITWTSSALPRRDLSRAGLGVFAPRGDLPLAIRDKAAS